MLTFILFMGRMMYVHIKQKGKIMPRVSGNEKKEKKNYLKYKSKVQKKVVNQNKQNKIFYNRLFCNIFSL